QPEEVEIAELGASSRKPPGTSGRRCGNRDRPDCHQRHDQEQQAAVELAPPDLQLPLAAARELLRRSAALPGPRDVGASGRHAAGLALQAAGEASVVAAPVNWST